MSRNIQKVFKTYYRRYLYIWVAYIGISSWLFTSGYENIILNIITFPFTYYLYFTIVMHFEIRRTSRYIEANYPMLWKQIKVGMMGRFKWRWFFSSKEKEIDEELCKVKVNFRKIIILYLLCLLTLPILLIVEMILR